MSRWRWVQALAPQNLLSLVSFFRTPKAELEEASRSTSYLYENVSRMSDSLFMLYEPNAPHTTTVDIFFFHGLQFGGAFHADAHLSTWTTADDLEDVWPQRWLSEDYPGARIMSISYDACIERSDTGGRMDLYLIGESLMLEIMWARKDHEIRPVILVGHGFGGLVIKQLCVHARNNGEKPAGGYEMSRFLNSIRGIFFYATPHKGMEGMQLLAENEGPLLRLAHALGEESARLDEFFAQLSREKSYQWIIYGLGETHATAGHGKPLVPEASSRFGDNYITVRSDHFSICRPIDKKCNKYQHLIQLIEAVDSKVQDETRPPQNVPNATVGVESLVTEIVEKHLQNHLFLGISGMGGVGKTTLAKLIFNRLYSNFEFTCFVAEMKLIQGNKGEVKKKILESMHRWGDPGPLISEGAKQVRRRSGLFVFDDIADYEHVELVAEIADDNGEKKSRFVVTTRNSELLRQLEVYGYDIYIHPHRVMKHEDARKLFITYAFPRLEDAPEQFKEVTEEVVKGCEGLPLTLEVLGKYLGGIRRMGIWSEIPTALRNCDSITCLEKRVWAKLQLSYDGLGEEEKNMFLDIVTLFFDGSWIGHKFSFKEITMGWSSLYGSVQIRLQTLVDRSLIYQQGWGFTTHEHLKRMGERIARKMGRICCWPPLTASALSILNRNGYPCNYESFFQVPTWAYSFLLRKWSNQYLHVRFN